MQRIPMIVFIKRKSIQEYYQKEQAMPIRCAFGSIGIMLFSALMIVIACTGIERLVA